MLSLKIIFKHRVVLLSYPISHTRCSLFEFQTEDRLTFLNRFVIILSNCEISTLLLSMSTGLDYVSELRPPTSLLFIPKWYMSIEPRWNDADRRKPKKWDRNLFQTLCPPQIQHGLTRVTNLDHRVDRLAITTWAMA